MFRSLFRFSIRDVLWLTVVVALISAWMVDKRATNYRWGAKAKDLRLMADTARDRGIAWQETAKLWETSAGALERILEEEGHLVTWRSARVEAKGYNLNRHLYTPSPVKIGPD